MIVPMKKVSVIVLAKEAEAAVAQLRQLGVLHVQNQQQPISPAINTLGEDINLIDSALAVLSQEEYSPRVCALAQAQPPDLRLAALHIVDSHKRIEQLNEYRRNMFARITLWRHWGDFEPRHIQALAEKGINFKLYQIPHKELGRLPEDLVVENIFMHAGLVHCAVISKGPLELPFKEIPLPKMSLTDMRRRFSEDERAIKLIKEDLKKHTCYRQALACFKGKLELELDFRKAIKGMGEAGSIMYISGFVPADAAGSLTTACRSSRWALSINDPAEDEQAPTLLRNPRWASLIAPVFKLLSVVPGYRELDISPLFLLFLSLFFGMIIGDAGYGALYMLLTFLLQKKLGKKIADKRVFPLFYLFSACAVFWGLLTGTVFGQEWYLQAGFKAFAPILNDTKFLQAFCFFLGAFHLSLGQAWQGLRKLPSLSALADAGWICVLWSSFFIAKALILNDPYPDFVNWLIAGGITLAVFFSRPQRNILKAFAQGLGAVALSLMNNFTDVVSYIRLFAVGLAGVAISDTVNSIAAGMGDNFIARLLILFVGHTLNIILGPLSVLVHGIRLNVLEFSGHANLTWSGVPYKPLKD